MNIRDKHRQTDRHTHTHTHTQTHTDHERYMYTLCQHHSQWKSVLAKIAFEGEDEVPGGVLHVEHLGVTLAVAKALDNFPQHEALVHVVEQRDSHLLRCGDAPDAKVHTLAGALEGAVLRSGRVGERGRMGERWERWWRWYVGVEESGWLDTALHGGTVARWHGNTLNGHHPQKPLQDPPISTRNVK